MGVDKQNSKGSALIASALDTGPNRRLTNRRLTHNSRAFYSEVTGLMTSKLPYLSLYFQDLPGLEKLITGAGITEELQHQQVLRPCSRCKAGTKTKKNNIRKILDLFEVWAPSYLSEADPLIGSLCGVFFFLYE